MITEYSNKHSEQSSSTTTTQDIFSLPLTSLNELGWVITKEINYLSPGLCIEQAMDLSQYVLKQVTTYPDFLRQFQLHVFFPIYPIF